VIDELRQEISDFLKFSIPDGAPEFTIQSEATEQDYRRLLISYPGAEGDNIPAYLLLPDGDGPFPAVLAHHQHNGERHLGKSEICGLVGDPLQAFGPALARQGIAVLAPDSICFEDRRTNRSGAEPDAGDLAQHFNEMCYRLVRGDTLMRKVLDDSARGVSLLAHHPLIDAQWIGTLGHSYGGNTVLFHMALDTRISFGCSSGAACTYQYKMAHGVGIETAEAIPGFAVRFDIPDLVRCMAPRHVMIVSSDDDPYSQDSDIIVESARSAWADAGGSDRLEHKRYTGNHPLTRERFDDIMRWFAARAA
jgi:dienelactone hydrolase